MKKLMLFVLFCSQASWSQNFGDLAQTPPMGWNSWNNFGCNVSEAMIKQMADAMVSSGMRDAGYQYIVIDDCWQVRREADGTIVADPERFPSGIAALAEYIHGLGLKFGLYSCAGTLTCAGRPGSKGYEVKDAETYASWNVDYLKYDWCYTEGQNSRTSYKAMSDALKASVRPIVFSICEWGSTQPWLWAHGIGHLWRTTGDIQANWGSIMSILDSQVGLEKYAGPGGWNDPDMLEIGNGNLTPGENRAHFSLWCLLAAPLMAGNDLRSMSRATIEILTNPEVIAVNQDSLGAQGVKLRDDGNYEVWRKPMRDGSQAIVFLNRSQIDKQMTIRWQDIGFSSDDILFVRDLWKKQDVGYLQSTTSATVAAHDVVMLRLWKKTPPSAIPTLSFSAPLDSSRFSVGDDIQFTVMAADADGEVVRVDVSANGEIIGTDSEHSDGWSASWRAEKPGIYQILAFATDNSGISAASQPITIYVEPQAGPYYGTPLRLPAVLEAEDYDGGGQGAGYFDSDDVNQGGQYRWDGVDIGLATGENSCYFVGWLAAGEWLHYTIDIPEDEAYDINLSNASTTDGGKCSFALDGAELGAIDIPRSGGATVWKTATLADVTLPAGVRQLKLVVDEKDFRLDNFVIDYALKALPAPWLHRDIGQTAIKGSAGIRKDKYLLKASGSDIWGTSDQFGFVYQEMQGDGEISARVLSLDNTDPWSKAGVMMRNSLNSTASHAMAIVSAANGVAFQRRNASGAASTHTAGSPLPAPYWVRLVRRGKLITGYESQDGGTWRRIDSESMTLNETIYVGLAVTAHNGSLVCAAQFDDVQIKSTNASVPPEGVIGENYHLYPLFPNPFNSTLAIKYDLNIDAAVQVVIYDLLGKKTRLLYEGARKAGHYNEAWDAKDDDGRMVASGIYICRMQIGDQVEVMKALYIK